MTIDDVDVVELNEAFAAQVIPIMSECDIPLEKMNPHGGAIALGHPFGMTGARIMATLLNDLESDDKTIGLETMCVAGGRGMECGSGHRTACLPVYGELRLRQLPRRRLGVRARARAGSPCQHLHHVEPTVIPRREKTAPRPGKGTSQPLICPDHRTRLPAGTLSIAALALSPSPAPDGHRLHDGVRAPAQEVSRQGHRRSPWAQARANHITAPRHHHYHPVDAPRPIARRNKTHSQASLTGDAVPGTG